MELAEIRPFEPQMAEIDLFTMPDAVGVGEPSVRKVKPYIAGHVTDGSSTFTFKVNGSDVTVSVSGGDWKYKPTAAITSLSFVGVPQLESLELNKITAVSTFNLDYPVVPVFKKCDATTENALVYVYHIRGTATENFSFTLKYIDDNNTVTTVTESAVIDENGKWDVTYSGKKVYSLKKSFGANTKLTFLEFTEQLLECSELSKESSEGAFFGTTNLEGIKFAKGTTFANVGITTIYNIFTVVSGGKLKELDLSDVTFENVNNFRGGFVNVGLEKIDIRSINTSKATDFANAFYNLTKLKDLIVPENSTMPISFSLQHSPITYDSMLRVAGWLKDLTGDTAQTVTFKADTYNALTAEQKAALTAIIVTEKGWNLATA